MCRKKLSPVQKKIRKTVAVFLSLLILFTVYFEIAVKHQLRDIIIRDMQPENYAVGGVLHCDK